VEQKIETLRVSLAARLGEFGDSSEIRLSRLRQELNDSFSQSRSESRQILSEFQTVIGEALKHASSSQGSQLGDFGQKIESLNATLAQQLELIRQTFELKLAELQSNNEQKLEQMRQTVDEQLQGTLERRLGESFNLVSQRLQAVHEGLGEMKAIAGSVGDLKRVLMNVKTRGTWGEIQLGALLEQILSPEQYERNVAPGPTSPERVEFAIRLPGGNGEAPVWLPIDAKFPQEDYQRLVEAAERGDSDGVAEAGKALEVRIKAQARSICEKYIAPPYSTDFGILFLSSEGLYAEVLRRPGLAETLQRDFRVVVAGPATLAALLNSLQIGFRTLAIQQRTSEVWTVLAGVKTEFGKFSDVLSKVKKKLEEASSQIEATEKRTRALNRKLREVEALPAEDAARLLPDAVETDATDEAPAEPELKLLAPASDGQLSKSE